MMTNSFHSWFTQESKSHLIIRILDERASGTWPLGVRMTCQESEYNVEQVSPDAFFAKYLLSYWRMLVHTRVIVEPLVV